MIKTLHILLLICSVISDGWEYTFNHLFSKEDKFILFSHSENVREKINLKKICKKRGRNLRPLLLI